MTSPTLCPTRLRTAAAALLVPLALTGCSSQVGASSEPITTTPDTTQTPASSTPDNDLRFVSPTAPGCVVTWVPGATLPEDYEWCSDDAGNPVAGVRIGSCEVVTYRGEMYAVPGERITAALGPLPRDPQFTEMLTACKRRPSRTA